MQLDLMEEMCDAVRLLSQEPDHEPMSRVTRATAYASGDEITENEPTLNRALRRRRKGGLTRILPQTR